MVGGQARPVGEHEVSSLYDSRGVPLVSTRSYCGTEQYMAPEMLLQRAHTRAVDWWGLGLLAHEMLASRHPFQGFSSLRSRSRRETRPPSFAHGRSLFFTDTRSSGTVSLDTQVRATRRPCATWSGTTPRSTPRSPPTRPRCFRARVLCSGLGGSQEEGHYLPTPRERVSFVRARARSLSLSLSILRDQLKERALTARSCARLVLVRKRNPRGECGSGHPLSCSSQAAKSVGEERAAPTRDPEGRGGNTAAPAGRRVLRNTYPNVPHICHTRKILPERNHAHGSVCVCVCAIHDADDHDEESPRSFFLDQLDWRMLALRAVPAPHVPNVASDLDVGHFDAEFTAEQPRDSDAPSARDRDDATFGNFFFDLFTLNLKGLLLEPGVFI